VNIDLDLCRDQKSNMEYKKSKKKVASPLKAMFDTATMTRAKKMVEKARMIQKDRESKASLDFLNDTSDFKDSPPAKFTMVKSKLKLKKNASKSNTKENRAKCETATSTSKSSVSSSCESSLSQDDVVVLKVSNKFTDPVAVVDLIDEKKESAGSSRENTTSSADISDIGAMKTTDSVDKSLQKICDENSDSVVERKKTDNNEGCATESGNEMTKFCQVCQSDVKFTTFEQHIISCLRSKFSRGKGQFG